MMTKEEVLAFMRPINKIGLIKGFRENSGGGLKEAKDAVEAALEVKLTPAQLAIYEQDHFSFTRDFNNYTPDQLAQREQQLLRLFGYADPVPELDDMAVKMKSAILLVIDNWAVLGFQSPKRAVQEILENFQEESWSSTCSQM